MKIPPMSPSCASAVYLSPRCLYRPFISLLLHIWSLRYGPFWRGEGVTQRCSTSRPRHLSSYFRAVPVNVYNDTGRVQYRVGEVRVLLRQRAERTSLCRRLLRCRKVVSLDDYVHFRDIDFEAHRRILAFFLTEVLEEGHDLLQPAPRRHTHGRTGERAK